MFDCSLARRSLGEGGCAKCNLQNGADGISDIEGKIARVAPSEFGNERVSNQTRFCRSRRGFSQVLQRHNMFTKSRDERLSILLLLLGSAKRQENLTPRAIKRSNCSRILAFRSLSKDIRRRGFLGYKKH
jgi:hypothetical protein